MLIDPTPLHARWSTGGHGLASGIKALPRPPTLTLFCGPPGAGKSTVAARLEAEGRGVRLATDDWQAQLGVEHADAGFHDRLQRLLYRHALTLLSLGVDVILEDGLWFPSERAQKFADARALGAFISWHVSDLDEQLLWQRLQQRNRADVNAYPMSRAELARVLSMFIPPTPTELASVDEVTVHRPRGS